MLSNFFHKKTTHETWGPWLIMKTEGDAIARGAVGARQPWFAALGAALVTTMLRRQPQQIAKGDEHLHWNERHRATRALARPALTGPRTGFSLVRSRIREPTT